MSEIRDNLKYTDTHEWALIEGDVVVCGISDYAQNEIGEIVFIELPVVGDQVESGNDVCVVESVKSASDIYAPVSGEIIEVNEKLIENPSLINESCYDDGWIFKIKINDKTDVDRLLSADEYRKVVSD